MNGFDAMDSSKEMREVTSELLDGFSPYLHQMIFDFEANALECELYDDIEQPVSLRVLRFSRLQRLMIVPHDVDDIDPDCTDSILGVESDGEDYHVTTERYDISFSCGEFQALTRSAES